MTATKEQERKALEQIKKIVTELGNDSYLATAFNGAFTLAANNIEMDAAFSTQEYIDMAHEAQAREKDLISQYNHAINMLKETLKTVTQDNEKLANNLSSTSERASEYAHKIDDLNADLKKSDGVIISLKAKLYDLIAL